MAITARTIPSLTIMVSDLVKCSFFLFITTIARIMLPAGKKRKSVTAVKIVKSRPVPKVTRSRKKEIAGRIRERRAESKNWDFILSNLPSILVYHKTPSSDEGAFIKQKARKMRHHLL